SVVMHKDKEDPHGGMLTHCHNLQEPSFRNRDLTTYEHAALDGDTFLQALNGFLMILTCEGEVFFATHSIESYLGFHQSDIVHQSVYELVHSEDREELQRQLLWNSFITAEQQQMSLQEVLMPHNAHLLERSFTVRFRCLLDNTSGFLRLDIRGRVKVLHGQNRKTEEPPLALFAICTPFGPPSLLEIPQKEVMFKSKHKLDLGLVSMDQRGKMLLGYSDGELANMGGYDLVHFDDLAYVASAHQELLKTGASGMIAYRFQTKEGQWQWLQTSSRLVYKNSKPDFVISTHRPLMEEEGRDLLGKRTMDFKVSYLDAGLTNSYFTDSDNIMTSVLPTATSPTIPMTPTNQRVNRRYKTQLRDFLSTCRTKRKLSSHQSPHASPLTPHAPAVQSLNSPLLNTSNNLTNNNHNINLNNNNSSPHLSTVMMDYLPTAAAENHLMTPIAAYHHHPNLYTQGGYGQTENALYMGQTFQTMYPDNLFHQYQRHHLTGYYTAADYQAAGGYVTTGTNGFLEVSPRGYESTGVAYHQLGTPKDDKLYACAQIGWVVSSELHYFNDALYDDRV
ncbi:aryl hydrocarbon receptor-like, partial [Ctenocephalides felis]|uniref:aryl hydrocarbon receptor-like n=1 Tax=Ctenocephalides felis TaxID=7515 RepID=UPI000E6E3D73